MDGAIPSISLRDNLIFNLGYLVPQGLQGSFTRNRFWVMVLSRLHPDPAAVRFVDGLRARYQSDYLWIRMLATKTLLVLDPAGVERVLEQSPYLYADGKPKRDGMRVFQPHAVTISRGEQWHDRRRFNESVLASGQPVHPNGDAILATIREEVAALSESRRTHWLWEDLDLLFGRIMRRVVFGSSARDDLDLTDLLRRLMQQANRPIKPKRSAQLAPFYGRITRYVNQGEHGSLVARFSQAPKSPSTDPAGQVPHWMFAMWETLAANTARALAAILAHPEHEARVRQELAGADLATPGGIVGLNYLGQCVQEAMRLWPTTPMLVRETVAGDALGGEWIPSGTQVLIWNSFNHRDRRRDPDADAFRPERWAHGRPSPLYNHLSSGPQVCAGVDLVLFISRAVIATILRDHHDVLVQPRLDPEHPLPSAFDHFSFEMAVP